MARDGQSARPFIDACVFHDWSSLTTLAPYLSEGWRELLLRQSDHSGPVEVRSARLYADPMGAKMILASVEGAQGRIRTSDFAAMKAQILDANGCERVVLGYDEGILATSFANYHVALEVVRAANDWMLDERLNRDKRLFGMVIVSTSLPHEAAAEVRRVGVRERMVAVALGANCLDKPFGHHIYYPIYEAAEELGLPLVLQIGADATADSPSSPVGGGIPTTFAEYRALAVGSHMSHVTSMIIQGVFERFPSLRVLLVGGGATWIAPWLWRLDLWYKSHAHEAPWLQQLPSAYFMDYVRVTTHGLEVVPETGRLEKYLSCLPGIDRLLVYASCYPNSSSEAPEEIAARLPRSWHASVFEENARALFRWPEGKQADLDETKELERTAPA